MAAEFSSPSLRIAFACLTLLIVAGAALGQEQPGKTVPLAIDAKIPLGNVAGRIDHMAVDMARRRLFVAELGNNTVGVVDLAGNKLAHRITGLIEPQGVAYVPETDTVFVANAGDGSVRVFRGSDYAPIARIDLGRDADNVRFDSKTGRVLVGFGSGGIAVIDPAKNEKIGQAALAVHPESFRINPASDRIFNQSTGCFLPRGSFRRSPPSTELEDAVRRKFRDDSESRTQARARGVQATGTFRRLRRRERSCSR
jgi:YVTN family beta-propeller protein